ncbi:MAG: DUF4230 domain-containing protein [Lunatimonas sp.]|uniref:DUF4230 domain-containing protein n=1 Tax=Lunatimonas sp. TaxID=2060141 RepID=UPI00263AB450|nr:DUF4230 domain-containing protein [Lunatimonas sp.]MCC5938190.1 DUF4230 domain-containing protein [Lunatimonas sp.]
MIRQILKSARLLLEIGLVIGILVLIYWWNPLGLFGGKLKLQPTATLSAQVRELGELVTAEYYGEVISTIEDTQVDKLDEPNLLEHANEVVSEIQEMLQQLKTFDELNTNQKDAILGSEQSNLNRRERRRLITDKVSRSNLLERLRFHGDWEALELLPKHNDVLNYLFDRTNQRTRPVRTNLNDNQLKDLLIRLYERPLEINRLWDENDFLTTYYRRRLEEMPKNEQRKKLAMIGRGTVKAGFDLRELTPNMFYINEVSKELHFFGLSAKILDADINPWFIPEKGVPGFDILTYNGRVNFKDAKKVKQYAIQKLETNAVNANILESAETFGGESLMRLFSLMTGKEINQVFFHNDRIIQLSQQIMKDRFINYEEAMMFESALRSEMKTIDSLQNSTQNRFNNQQLANEKWGVVNQLAKEMQNYPFENDGCRYGCFSTWAFSLSHAGLIDEVAQDSLSRLRTALKTKPVLPDSLFTLWAGRDSLFLMDQFNQAVQFLMAANTPVGKTKTIEFAGGAVDSLAVDSLRAGLISFSPEKSVFAHIQASMADSVFLMETLFPFRYVPSEWEMLAGQRYKELPENTDYVSLQGIGATSFLVNSQHGNGPWKLISVPFSQLVHPLLVASFTERRVICLDERVCIALSPEQIQSGPPVFADRTGITSRQGRELAAFIEYLVRVQEAGSNLGPVTRANLWFTRKLQRSSAVVGRATGLEGP